MRLHLLKYGCFGLIAVSFVPGCNLFDSGRDGTHPSLTTHTDVPVSYMPAPETVRVVGSLTPSSGSATPGHSPDYGWSRPLTAATGPLIINEPSRSSAWPARPPGTPEWRGPAPIATGESARPAPSPALGGPVFSSDAPTPAKNNAVPPVPVAPIKPSDQSSPSNEQAIPNSGSTNFPVDDPRSCRRPL